MIALPRSSANAEPAVIEALTTWPSPSPYCETLAPTSTPSKSFLVMKFTTPEMASEPYTAEAPPVTMSIRSMIGAGMRLMSTAPEVPNGGKRLPSISTSVRLEPKPRRLMVAAPGLPLLMNSVEPGRNCGSWRSWLSRLTVFSCSRVSAVTVVIGLVETASGFAMRVPVTVTSSSVFCAMAGAATVSTATPDRIWVMVRCTIMLFDFIVMAFPWK